MAAASCKVVPLKTLPLLPVIKSSNKKDVSQSVKPPVALGRITGSTPTAAR